MEFAVELDQVVKRYARTTGYRQLLRFWRPRQYITALDGVSLQVERGTTFGVLGANGAGKTTLLKVLSGLVLADEGAVIINGEDVTRSPTSARESLMYVSIEERSHYWRLTGRQNLQFFATQNGIRGPERDKRVDELISLVGLEDAAREHVMKYSTGMRQRLSIARGLLSNPDILLLDEPTRSMDPVGARELWEFISKELSEKQGKTILIATHNMEEAAFLCHQVAIVHRGRVELCDSVAALTSRFSSSGHYSISVGRTPMTAIEGLRSLAGVNSITFPHPPNGHIDFDVVVDDSELHIPMIVDSLVQAGGQVLTVERRTTSLGDVIAGLARGHES